MNSRQKWLLLAVGLGIMLNPLNSSMISVALIRLQRTFGMEYTSASWIIFAFYIASAVAQPVMGKASDVWGSKRIFLAGQTMVFTASLLAPLAPGFGWLVALRILQSIGTSMMAAVGMALVRIHISAKSGAALSALSLFLSGAAAVGPFVGGLLTYWGGWEAIFLVNLPLTAAGYLLARKVVPDDAPLPANSRLSALRSRIPTLGIPGMLLFAFGLTALLLGILSAKSSGHAGPAAISLMSLGAVLLIAFVRHEYRSPSPFIPLRTFHENPALYRVNLEYVLVNLLYYSLFFGMPPFLQTVRRLSEYQTGLLMLCLGLCSLAVAPAAGKWVDRSGPRPALTGAAVLMTLGSLLLTAVTSHSSFLGIAASLAAFGAANGLNSVAMQAALFRSAPKTIIGVASGVFNTSRYLGTILASLLIGLVMGDRFTAAGLRWLGGGLTAVAFLLLILSRRHQPEKEDGR
ncbi:MFS transporter [Paenibacillus spiritus]|uniref:MFS transporter n=1 Tax=Paenibacillus spiritus TaxID=2496557 RepID=A0A5J5G9I3_9BACL|nr:MFS transporter [Paenibacillus spiritus]KAA9004271.1 MFS transporter [Paenibacillus spiritus]